MKNYPGQTALVLQGGGALGAYQVGVYEALHEAGIEPDWVIGTDRRNQRGADRRQRPRDAARTAARILGARRARIQRRPAALLDRAVQHHGQSASRAKSHIARQQQIHHLRHIIRELSKELPAKTRNSPKAKELASWGCGTTMHVARLVAPKIEREDHTKDIDFTPAGIRARGQAGYADTQRMVARTVDGARRSDERCGNPRPRAEGETTFRR